MSEGIVGESSSVGQTESLLLDIQARLARIEALMAPAVRKRPQEKTLSAVCQKITDVLSAGCQNGDYMTATDLGIKVRKGRVDSKAFRAAVDLMKRRGEVDVATFATTGRPIVKIRLTNAG